jgi:hypothetical protein
MSITSELFSLSDVLSTFTDTFSFGVFRAEWWRSAWRVLGEAGAGCKHDAAAALCPRGNCEMALGHFTLVKSRRLVNSIGNPRMTIEPGQESHFGGSVHQPAHGPVRCSRGPWIRLFDHTNEEFTFRCVRFAMRFRHAVFLHDPAVASALSSAAISAPNHTFALESKRSRLAGSLGQPGRHLGELGVLRPAAAREVRADSLVRIYLILRHEAK